MGRTLYPILLGIAALFCVAEVPAVQAGDSKGPAPAASAAIPWDDPGHRDFFEFQRWAARLSAEGRAPKNLPLVFDTEESWKALPPEERAARLQRGEGYARMLRDGSAGGANASEEQWSQADREAVKKLLGSHVDLDPRMSAVNRFSGQVRAPDEFKRFVEGSQLLPSDVAFQPPGPPQGARSGAGAAGRVGQGSVLQPSARPSPGRSAVPGNTAGRAAPSGPGNTGPGSGLMLLAFAAGGLGLAFGMKMVLGRALQGAAAGGAPGGPGAGSGAGPRLASRPMSPGLEPGPEPSMFRPTPQHGAGGSAPGSGLRGPSAAGEAPSRFAFRSPSTQAGPGMPGPSLTRPPAVPGPGTQSPLTGPMPADPEDDPAPPPSLEGFRPAAWWAITKEEQLLLDLWGESPEKAQGSASFESWLDFHPELAAGIDASALKQKLHRNVGHS